MDIKKITYIITNRLEGLTLAVPMFVVGLGFMILGVTLFPVIGILVGIFIWWVAWRFMLSSSRKSRIKEALKRIKEKQAALLSSSISKYKAPMPESDVKRKSGTKSTATSEGQETTKAGSDH
jgi:ABC-type bacteriocin/lantibiotic exporter with double-glycine peptidase domain